MARGSGAWIAQIVKGADADPPDPGWSNGAIFGVAALIAALMSTEFLVQPFVWRNWAIEDVLGGWMFVLRDRLIVAVMIAGALVLARRFHALGSVGRAIAIGLAVVVGAVAGENLILAIDPFGERRDLVSVLGRTLRWSLAAAALAGILASWRHGAGLTADAEQARLRQARTQRLITTTQLEALRWQIEPHFLFNTLAIVGRLGRTTPAEGRRMIARLFDFVSAAFAAAGTGESTLGAELDLVSAYLDVCIARAGPRLTVEWSVDPRLRDRVFPPLMLGTLVENAIEHGLGPLPGGGVLRISAQLEGAMLCVGVRDNGVGLVDQGGAGLGLANLSARLRLIYGGAARFALQPGPDRGVQAMIRIPDAPLG